MLIFCIPTHGQNVNETEEVSVSIVPLSIKDIPQEASNYLTSKMEQLVATNGMADYGYNGRFVLTAKVNIISKNITPTTPTRISQKLEIVFMIGDIVSNTLFDTTSLIVSGIGTNEINSSIKACQHINRKNLRLTNLFENAKKKIVAYYANNCNTFITEAQTLATMGKYDEAIHILISAPNVCNDCYNRCQEALTLIYQTKIDEEGIRLLNLAKAEWTKDASAEGASRALTYTSSINNLSACYSDVESLYETISKKLLADEKKIWDFQKKQYDDKQIFKQSIVEACKAIGVAFGQGQPQNVTRNIISRW